MAYSFWRAFVDVDAHEGSALMAHHLTQQLRSGIATSAMSRGVAMLAPFVTVPVSLEYLGATVYGAWAAALSLTSVAIFADLGMGAGLMTKLAAVTAANDTHRARRLISTAYCTLATIVLLCLAGLWGSSMFIDWARVIGGSEGAGDGELEVVVLITISGFVVNIVASLIIRVQYGLHQVSKSNIWQGAASLVGILAVFAAAALDPGSGAFIAAAAFAPVVVAAINTCIFFGTRAGSSVSPRPGSFGIVELRDLSSMGGRFLLITVLMSIGLSTDSWIVAQTVSLTEVPEYAIPARIFGMIGVVVAILTTPLWPMHSRALQSGDVDWVQSITRRMTIVTTLSVSALAFVAVLIGPRAIDWWLEGAISPSPVLLLGFGLLAVVHAVVAPMFMAQNGGGVLGPQTIGYTLFLVVVPLKWFVASAWGIDWIPFVAVVLFCIFVWPAAFIGYKRTIRGSSTDDGTSAQIGAAGTSSGQLRADE